MGKLTKRIAGGMKKSVKKAIRETPENAQDAPESSAAQELLQSGVKAHKARSGTNTASDEGSNSLFQELGLEEEQVQEPMQQEKKMKTIEDICNEEIERAHRENLELPDFDFRNYYEKGQHLWFVRYHTKLNSKELVEFIVRTVYARMVVGSQPKSICHCVSVNMRHQLFEDKRDAQAFYDSLKLAAEEDQKSKKGKQDEDEYDEEDSPEQVPLEELEKENEDE